MTMWILLGLLFAGLLSAQAPLPSPNNGGGGGSMPGTVTSVATGCGLSGGTITTTGTIISSQVTNAQTGTSYAVLSGDCGKQVTLTNTLSISVTLPQAGGSFPNGWWTVLKNIGAGGGLGVVTVTPTTSTINGGPTLVIPLSSACTIFSDGTNYQANCTNTSLHVITFAINGGGSAITTGALGVFPTADYACTINRYDVSGTPSGSITVDIWKAAGAIPTSSDKISASAPVTLSSTTLNQNGSLAGWSKTVTAGDVFGGTIASASAVTAVTVQIWCLQP
jgi:hypothetical protein